MLSRDPVLVGEEFLRWDLCSVVGAWVTRSGQPGPQGSACEESWREALSTLAQWDGFHVLFRPRVNI